METLEPILADHPFFKDLEKKYLTLVTGCASNVRFDSGKFIFREGEEAHQFYLIREGKVSVEIFTPNRGHITLETLDEGNILGWSWLIPPYQWHFDARVVEPTRAIALDGKCLRKKCEDDHDFGYEFLKRFSHIMEQRLSSARIQLLDLYDVRA
ncbi:MAG TPA: cyclic nucleotide-binding domain-containing protein [Bacteroidota bacterium]